MTQLQAAMSLALMLGMATSTAGVGATQPPPTDRYGDPLPPGTIARLGTVRLRASGAQFGLSPDGKTIVSVNGGRQVKLLDADTGKLRLSRELPVRFSHQVFLSSDGRLLAVREPGFDTPLDIWDVSVGKRLQRFPIPQGTGIYRATFALNGKTLAVAESGPVRGIIRLWEMDSGKQRELKGLARSPDTVVFSPDSKLLVASDGRSLICWDLSKGEKLWQTGSAFNRSFAFTPDGQTLISSPGSRENDWHAWDAATGKAADNVKLPQGYDYANLAIAPDGRTLVFAQSRYLQGSDGRVRLWDLRTGKLLHTLSGGGQIGPFFPDGKSFLTNDGIAQRWELASGRPLLPDVNEMGHRSEVLGALYSRDGRRLVSAAKDGTIRLWDIATAKPLHILRGHEAIGVAFTPDGKLLLSGGVEDRLYVWNTETGEEVRHISLHDPKREEKKQNVMKLHITPDGRTVIALGYDPASRTFPPHGILTSWDLATGQQRTRVETRFTDGFYSAFLPDVETLVSTGELLDTSTGKTRVKLEGKPGGFAHYAVSSDGRLVAGLLTQMVREDTRLYTKVNGIQIWDAATGRALRRIPTDWVGQLAFSPDGRYLAAADLQGIRLFELATGQVALKHKAHETMRGSYGNSFASCLSISPDGRTLTTGHVDTTVLIWDLVPSHRPATAEDLPRLWDDLIAGDVVRAYAAYGRMSDSPNNAIRYLRERLRPVSPPAAEQLRALLADLDSDDFNKRESAATRLREMGDRAAKSLRETLQARPSLETRHRVEELLKDLEKPPSAEVLRQLRAVAVLERIGTQEAQQILKTIAQGMPEARLTSEAKASLKRLTARHPAEQR